MDIFTPAEIVSATITNNSKYTMKYVGGEIIHGDMKFSAQPIHAGESGVIKGYKIGILTGFEAYVKYSLWLEDKYVSDVYYWIDVPYMGSNAINAIESSSVPVDIAETVENTDKILEKTLKRKDQDKGIEYGGVNNVTHLKCQITPHSNGSKLEANALLVIDNFDTTLPQ
eukprot:TRINITY_DN1749_c0_g1_i1.p1 TRINITY_DN1749_c0_g1~~TRINITY_DN1749_c0_g1_i1.p1  ORF type:complete len:170 (+),score=41.20 TRINITY_DN1749_c0_g1_i1:81-590(+)